jgi:hypothetical protein
MDLTFVNVRQELPAYYQQFGYVENGTLPGTDRAHTFFTLLTRGKNFHLQAVKHLGTPKSRGPKAPAVQLVVCPDKN